MSSGGFRRRRRKRLAVLRHRIDQAGGSVLDAVKADAEARVEWGRVWGLERDLAVLGLLDDDATAVINGVVAHRLSDPRHDVQSKRVRAVRSPRRHTGSPP